MKFFLKKEKLKNSYCPFLLIDDSYDNETSKEILKELNYLVPGMLPPDKTGSASDKENNALKKNKGKFIEPNSKLSVLVNSLLQSGDVVTKIEELDYLLFLQFKTCKRFSILASYYENADFYKSHADRSVITSISWFYNMPKSFEGGELSFPELGFSITPRNNRTIFFLGSIEHQVQKINLKNQSSAFPGRFSITKFYFP